MSVLPVSLLNSVLERFPEEKLLVPELFALCAHNCGMASWCTVLVQIDFAALEQSLYGIAKRNSVEFLAGYHSLLGALTVVSEWFKIKPDDLHVCHFFVDFFVSKRNLMWNYFRATHIHFNINVENIANFRNDLIDFLATRETVLQFFAESADVFRSLEPEMAKVMNDKEKLLFGSATYDIACSLDVENVVDEIYPQFIKN